MNHDSTPDHADGTSPKQQGNRSAPVPGAKWFATYTTAEGHAAAHELLIERGERLTIAIERARQDPAGKRIKKLRVATRRADIAARFAQPVASKPAVKAARARLRTLRQAGGAVRRCDVFIGRLSDTMAAAGSGDVAAAAGALIGRFAAERSQVLTRFVSTVGGSFDAVIAPATLKLDAGAAASTNDLAMTLLRDAGAAFAADAAVSSMDFVALHDLRLRGKRLRYVAEATASVIGPEAAASLITAVEPLQDELGCINDLAELAAELSVFIADLGDLSGVGSLASGAERLFLTAASERDRRAVAFGHHRRERLGQISDVLSGLKPRPPRPPLRIAEVQSRSESA